jgi:hypothetical protein
MKVSQLSLIFSICSALVVAVDPPSTPIALNSISYTGGGCPDGSLGMSLGNSSINLALTSFAVSIGPSVSVDNTRKVCDVTAEIAVPTGYTFTPTTVEIEGFLQGDSGVVAQYQTSLGFSGQSESVSACQFGLLFQSDVSYSNAYSRFSRSRISLALRTVLQMPYKT